MEKKKSKSTSTVNKTVKVDKNIKQQVKDESNNKKIIIVSLILALLLAIFAYWQITKNNKGEEKKPTENKNDVVEKEEEPVVEETEDNEDSAFVDFVDKYVKPMKVEKEEEKEEKPEVVYYSLSFETNGGNIIEKQILAQDEVSSLVLPLKEGWVFQGWYIDNEFSEPYTFGNVLTEDITVYAKWGKYVSYMYEQSFYEKENIIAENEVIPFLSEDKMGIIPEGYVLGWFIENNNEAGEIISSIEVLEGTVLTEEIYSNFDSEEIILTAKYLEKFNVEFFEEEISNEPLYVQEVIEGRVIPFEQAGNVVEEKFTDIEEYGWYYLDENSIKWNVSANQKADKNITKLYLDETYKLIYTEEPDEDTIITEEDKTLPNGNIIIKEEYISKDSQVKEEDIFKPLEKEGYEFIGWFLIDELTGDTTNEMFTEETIIDGNKIYVAKWKEIIVDETVENNTEITEEPENSEEPVITEELEPVEEKDVENEIEEIQEEVIVVTEDILTVE